MTVQRVIDLAKSSELKQLAIKNDDTALIGFLNLGVLELYKRFSLEEAEAVLWLTAGKTSYKLDGTDNDVTMDNNKELLLITRAFDEEGDPIVINSSDYKDITGINTPAYNVVEIPYVIQDEYISIMYRVTPKFMNNLDDIVPIPPQLLEALLSYIGYKGHGSVDGSLRTENQSHYVRFEESCKKVLLEGLIQQELLPSNKFKARGFV